MVAIVPFIRSLSNMDDSVAELNRWLVDQAIHVPDGWVEACVQWLVEEHGGLHACNQLTMSDWCQLIYEQWLHTDLHQLACAVLPESAERTVTTSDYRSRTSSLAMKLEGELCLQVVGLFNVGDSYYGQLRHNEGNLSANIPPLDNLDADLGADPDLTQMTQAVSQYNTLGWNSQYNSGQHAANSSCKSYALFLTDGLTQIKAVEFGSLVRTGRFAGQRVLSVDELNRRLRPGVKVRLRGPLTLRNNVLLLPAGAIDTLGHPQLQVLGGEVDEVLTGQTGNLMYQLGVFLARKLNISLPDDGTLPAGFPRVTQLGGRTTADSADTTTEREMTAHDDHAPVVPMVQLVASSSGGQALEPWDNDDDALLTEAAQSFEQLMSSSSSQVSKSDFNQPETKPCSQLNSAAADASSAPNGDDSWGQTDISLEVDPDVLASAFDELESANLVNKPCEFTSPDRPDPTPSPTPAAKQGASTRKNLGVKSSLRQTVLNVTAEKPAVSNTDITTTALPTVVNASESDDLLPPAPKRKPWERRKPLPSANQLTSGEPSTSATSQLTNVPQGDFSFRPFCYIQDMYNELVRTTSSGSMPRRRIYTIRGLLISLLSSLEHHQGTRWTLAARLADGSATVDLDISSELLTSWIGLTAAESESLRQMSRVAATGSEANVVALQEAQKHRHRLRSALSNFQARLANLAGLFDITPPTPTSLGAGDSSEEKPIRPILVGYRPLDGDWLTQLHNRVLARWGTRVLD